MKTELDPSWSMEALDDATLARLTISAVPETAARAVEEIFRRRESVAHSFFWRRNDEDYFRYLEFEAGLAREDDPGRW